MSPALVADRPGLIDVLAALATALVGILAAIATVLDGARSAEALPATPVAMATAVAPDAQSRARSAAQPPASPLPVRR